MLNFVLTYGRRACDAREQRYDKPTQLLFIIVVTIGVYHSLQYFNTCRVQINVSVHVTVLRLSAILEVHWNIRHK